MAGRYDPEKERLKREVSIQRLAEARGIKLHRSGKELIGLCPFHDDRNPSLNIDPVANVWHCKGACGEGGDVIRWVARSEGVSDAHAIALLKRDYAPSTGPVVKIATIPKLPCPVTLGADDRTVMREVVRFYADTLRDTADAKRYLEKRGLRSSELVERFRLGFSDRMLGPALPDKNRRAGAEIRQQLERLGVFRASGHEHLRGSLVIPVLNLDGDVVQLYGRKINDNLRGGTDYHLYLPGPMRGVWNEEALVATKEIILCEALIDAMTFWCAGYRQVTASYGVNGFTKDHRAAFERHGIERVYIAYDGDEAGNKAAVKLADELMQRGVECFRVEFPKGMDANEYAHTTQPATKLFGLLLNRATWLGKGPKPASRVAVPVIVPEPQSAPPLPAAPAAEETAAKEKISAAKEPEAAPESQPVAKPIIETIPSAVSETPQPQPQRVFSLAAEAVPVAQMPLRSNAIDAPVEMRGEDIVLRYGDREYRVRGLNKNTSPTALQVNLRVLGLNAHGDMAMHVDKLDLEASRPRAAFIKQAAEELGVKEDVIRHDLGRLILKLEILRDEQIARALAPEEPVYAMSEEEREAAINLLRDPRLVERIVEDFAECGVVGEETNKLVGYLGIVSRHLSDPLAVLVQSSSAAGKSSLMDAVLAFVPEEQKVQYSAMTGRSLFYMGETDLKHKVLAIAEEEGASQASYALKLLQSEHKLSIASTGKDPVSGKLITHEYKVEGPVMIFFTTTAMEIDEELLNRCIVLTVNEDREQTQAIHRIQRASQTLAGLLRRKDREELRKLHQNAQRLLRPLEVVNELAPELSFPDSMTRTRRDHAKFLALIRSIALLHQWQREVKTGVHRGKAFEYIEATSDDVKLAKKIIEEVMGRSLDDMPVQTRKLLLMVDGMVRGECDRQQIECSEYRFSRRDVRAFTRWSDSQLKRHLGRLEELEYLIVHRGGRGQSFVYELFFDGAAEASQSSLLGMEHSYDGEKSGVEGPKSGPSPAQVRGMSGSGTGNESPISMRPSGSFYGNGLKNTTKETAEENPVVVVPPRVNGAAHGGGARWPA
ncbi:MAG TPA: toprim domain-containing protein [Edaphobacter sp.]|uniref:toprim domain-containing protein n=1 Tax=Edaphobacter sp. TaxID=1934404 RepID=UPI002BEFA617|nr:toprim domain-containing protein [Edaphobacter sp.]HUZ95957.1 toprim domain-containing protein [Edaphobacter sp.]